jgi:hypothetical protein
MGDLPIGSIIQNIISVLGTLSGIWLGSTLTRSKEDRQWRRDRCLEAYTDVMEFCETVTNAAHKLYLNLSDNHTKQLEVLTEEVDKFHRATQKAALLCPTEMRATIQALVVHVDKEIATKAGLCPKMSLKEWTKVTTTDRAVIAGQFWAEARRDLDVHPEPGILKRLRATPG